MSQTTSQTTPLREPLVPREGTESSEHDPEIVPLRDLRRSDWALRAFFAVLTLLALVSQLQPELVEWFGGGSVQPSK